jgi:hypothetical protein
MVASRSDALDTLQLAGTGAASRLPQRVAVRNRALRARPMLARPGILVSTAHCGGNGTAHSVPRRGAPRGPRLAGKKVQLSRAPPLLPVATRTAESSGDPPTSEP